MSVEGYDYVTEALELGNGVILALPHLGGWEWAGRWLVDRGHGLTVVVEAIEPPELFDWFSELRASSGCGSCRSVRAPAARCWQR